MKACSDTHSAPLGACFPYFLLEKAVCRPAGSLFLCECEIPNGLALSVTACAVPPLPKGEALAWRQSFRLNCKVYSFARSSPFGRAGALAPERARTLSRSATPSVIACGDATFPKGTAFGGGGKVSGNAQRRPLGGAGTPSGVTERVRLQTPPVKRQFWKIRRFSRIAKFKIFFPLNMARAQRKPF